VGGRLLERWNLPEALSDAVARHHGEPCLCHSVDCAVVAAAVGIASALTLDCDRDQPVEPVAPVCWDLAGVRPEVLPALAEQVERQFEEVALALGVGHGS
jgi:HD-like signal output (HDOD) protein